MPECQRKRQKKPLTFAYALRSFMGYLEGTEKALHTVKNYQSDLRSFEDFLERGLGSKRVLLHLVQREDLEQYHEFLKAEGFKSNTRRRKLLTVRRLLRYLTQRNQIGIDVGKKLPTPHKIERVPYTVPGEELLTAIRALPTGTELQARNRVLLWVLAETGCQVSEVTQVRPIDFESDRLLTIRGKASRTVEISKPLAEAARTLPRKDRQSPLFPGHNKFGPLGGAITSRGVELLVKGHSIRLGFPKLTPRTFRHSAVIRWHQEGTEQNVIQKRLGLRTAYAFRIYAPMLAALPPVSDPTP